MDRSTGYSEEKMKPNQSLQTISCSVTVAAEPLCVPPHEMSDLKRSAKSDSRNIEFWSANYRYAYESQKKKEVAGMRKRRGEAIAINKNHQHEETEPTQMKVSSLRKNTELNQSLQTMQFAVTPAASHPSRQPNACLI
jgi:hypothetical protein